jgi:hypothetical protein
MTDDTRDDIERIPCIRGCVWEPTMEGEQPRPKEAKHGGLCDSCFYRMRYALKAIPDMMANMRLKMVPNGVANYESERVKEKEAGSPAPLNVDVLDISDMLFAKLVLWVDNFAQHFRVTPPSIRVWMGFREVQGSRPVSARAAHDQAAQLTSWFLVRLEQIAESSLAVEFHDDICYGWDDSPGVYKLGQYGTEPRQPRKHECPVCGAREVFVKWPDKFDPDIAVLCGRCKWVAEPEKYGHYEKLFGNA